VIAAAALGLIFSGRGPNASWAALASLVVLVVGVVLAIRRRDNRLGEGLILGWAISLLLVPLVLFGLCVQLLSQNNY
jgi:uncharacterized membrane protein YhdT